VTDHAAPDPAAPDPDELRCATCGRALDGDPDEDPSGDAGLPICGECERSRDVLALDIADGTLDDDLESER
jgi:hypothetical protein